MKKRYLFMSSFFVVGTIFTLVFFLSYRSYDKSTQVPESEQANPVDTIKENRVNASMKYIVENYDVTTGVVTKEESDIPAELAGKTREELENYLDTYNQEEPETRNPDDPDSMELISFSEDRLVLRQTYDGAEPEKGFFLKIGNDEVVIYHNDQVTPYEYTGISTEILPEDELIKLQKGYYVADERELYSVLENLSS